MGLRDDEKAGFHMGWFEFILERECAGLDFLIVLDLDLYTGFSLGFLVFICRWKTTIFDWKK